MSRARAAYFLIVAIILGLFLVTQGAASASFFTSGASQPTAPSQSTPLPQGQPATAEQLAKARAEWARSGHAQTYDDGMGANTTCASCKSPRNWDPASPAVEAAHDCGSCKRVPGAPRPELSGGVAVPESEWKNISCDICHQPAGESFSTAISFWNQAAQKYEPVASTTELCAKCHSKQHGFMVIEEQAASAIHKGWDCIRCHGPHGDPVLCTDCHDPKAGRGAPEHARHPSVNCTACHDAGNLSIWQDPLPGSRHAGQYMPRRYAHALRSWPSHNLTTTINCQRCHHPLERETSSIVPSVGCTACHAEGAAWFWCNYFKRSPDPYLQPAAQP